jgi:FkbM family methyltransferase
MRKLFSIKHGRLGWLKALWRQPAARYLQGRARAHLAAGRRQVAVFAFEHIGQAIEFDGVYELAELEAFFAWAEAVSPGSFKTATALDIGANIGNHSLFFSDRFASVVSFEPSARTYRLLECNAALVGNVRCHNFGLSDADREAAFAVHEANRGANRIAADGQVAAETVRLRRLDDVAGLPGEIKLVKMDVEGHEAAVLRGAEALLRRHRPVVMFELGPQEFGPGGPPAVSLLKSYGYRRFATVRRYPRLGSGWPIRLRIVAEAFLRALVGEEMRVVLEDELSPDFYHMVIAIPDWLEASAPER